MNKLITSYGDDLTESAFWSFELELDTCSNRTDISLMPSEIETVLDALIIHKAKLFKELEWYRDDWKKETKQKWSSFPMNDVIRLMEEIKNLSNRIDAIALILAANLREAGNTIRKRSKEKRGGHV
ncbi:hypothetical protein [Spirosoma sp. KNUC1025]|uniref:hypothetical protein n=1 Tax=Spirosoma sp. KNUC1025 TaxID=2894082 RepID=UPI00387023C6|nr:hypothetical protein LN737_00630 [Spirosoma sp. KNUC1025]